MSIRVPQAMSTNRALAVTGDGTTAVKTRLAVPDEVEAVTGGRAGASGRVIATPPTAIRHAAAAAAVPTNRRRCRRSRRTARANDGSNVSGTGSGSAVSWSSDTLDIRPGRPASSLTELAHAGQIWRWSSNSRRSAGDKAPRTYAASYRANSSVVMVPPPFPPVPGAGPAVRNVSEI